MRRESVSSGIFSVFILYSSLMISILFPFWFFMVIGVTDMSPGISEISGEKYSEMYVISVRPCCTADGTGVSSGIGVSSGAILGIFPSDGSAYASCSHSASSTSSPPVVSPSCEPAPVSSCSSFSCCTVFPDASSSTYSYSPFLSWSLSAYS